MHTKKHIHTHTHTYTHKMLKNKKQLHLSNVGTHRITEMPLSSHPLLHMVDNDTQNDDLTVLFIMEEGKNKVLKILLQYFLLVFLLARQISVTQIPFHCRSFYLVFFNLFSEFVRVSRDRFSMLHLLGGQGQVIQHVLQLVAEL